MEDERVILHNWEDKIFFQNLKMIMISQNVSETILTLRWYLVGKIIEELKALYHPKVIQIIQSLYQW
jgi:DNA primase